MQLRSLQNPFFFFNNPLLWPRLHTQKPKVSQIQIIPLQKVGCIENSMSGFSPLGSSIAFNNGSEGIQPNGMEQLNMNIQSLFFFFFGDLIYGKNRGCAAINEDQLTDQFDCFKEIDASRDRDSMSWWANDFDTKSSSSNSWDSTSVLQTEGGASDLLVTTPHFASNAS
ncbi:hypothetical protein NE237_002316 [Protea cynaroides]|uniref:Uncharacterized protein n=1 Tax=Protea cynaroides TaxID=273540 RepID=A0A9Q0KV00_9MAGN|nr:hypothetical protein NE237_002316 [Protea cynaroides]